MDEKLLNSLKQIGLPLWMLFWVLFLFTVYLSYGCLNLPMKSYKEYSFDNMGIIKEVCLLLFWEKVPHSRKKEGFKDSWFANIQIYFTNKKFIFYLNNNVNIWVKMIDAKYDRVDPWCIQSQSNVSWPWSLFLKAMDSPKEGSTKSLVICRIYMCFISLAFLCSCGYKTHFCEY